MKTLYVIFLCLIFPVYIFGDSSVSMANPAAVYCENFNGKYDLTTELCTISDSLSCNSWELFDNNTCNGSKVCEYDDNCSTNEFCYKNSVNSQGICMEKPEVCNEVYMPVCGFDGSTYSNSCFANGQGVNVAYSGECIDTTGLTFNNDYPDSEFRTKLVTREVLLGGYHLSDTNKFYSNQDFQLLFCVNSDNSTNDSQYKVYIAYYISNTWYLQKKEGSENIMILDSNYLDYPFLTVETGDTYNNKCFDILSYTVPEIKDNFSIDVYSAVFKNNEIDYIDKITINLNSE